MNIGISLWNLKGDLARKIQRVVDLGFNSISFLGSSFEEKESMAKIIRDNNLIITFHLSFFGISEDKIIKGLDYRLNRILQFIKSENLEKNVWSISFDPVFKNAFDFEATVMALKYTLKKIKNIHLSLENWIINSRISDLIKIKKAVNNKRLGMLLDIGHLNIAFKKNLTDKKNLCDYLKALPFEIIEFHIHDNDGQTDSHLPIGKGNIDMVSLLKTIKKSAPFHKDAVFTLEIKPKKGIKEILSSKKIVMEVFYGG
ncbi:MAG: TIM barrel protein [Candidatus Firestonebacteria bacterium]